MSDPNAPPQAAGRHQASPEQGYDRTSRAPIDRDGWQIVDLGEMLFAGGPRACRAASPRMVFYFGLDLRPTSGGRLTATVTQLGRPSRRWAVPTVLTTPELARDARDRVQSYLLENWRFFRSRPIAEVVFAGGDGRLVDVF